MSFVFFEEEFQTNWYLPFFLHSDAAASKRFYHAIQSEPVTGCNAWVPIYCCSEGIIITGSVPLIVHLVFNFPSSI